MVILPAIASEGKHLSVADLLDAAAINLQKAIAFLIGAVLQVAIIIVVVYNVTPDTIITYTAILSIFSIAFYMVFHRRNNNN